MLWERLGRFFQRKFKEDFLRKPVKIKDIGEKEYENLIKRSFLQFEKVLPRVISIVNEVKDRGDEAFLEFTEKFDGVRLSSDSLILTDDEVKKAYRNLPSSLVSSLKRMCQQVRFFHQNQLERRKNWSCKGEKYGDYTLGEFFSPVEKAAIYVPGGKASYPSTAVMGCIPAKLAGVKEVVVCSPPSSGGEILPEVVVAAHLAGADLIVKGGGAQAVAALAFGTSTFPRVDLIAGPGNIYVTCAKAYLASLGEIGIDCPAGPSEVLIIADNSAPPDYIVWDMLSQAEHDEASFSVLVTTSRKLAFDVWERLEREANSCKRKKIILSSLEKNSFILLAENLEEAVNFANKFAPEHLEIITGDPEKLLPFIKNAGSVFLGPFSPVAAGDYFTGCNHILPTGGSARFLSGLSVDTFLKRISYQKLSLDTLLKMKEHIEKIALQEGLEAHLKSIEARLE